MKDQFELPRHGRPQHVSEGWGILAIVIGGGIGAFVLLCLAIGA